MTEQTVKKTKRLAGDHVLQVGFDSDLYAKMVQKAADRQIAEGRRVPMTEIIRDAVARYCA